MAYSKDDLRLLRLPDVMEIFPVSRMTIYRLIKKNEFPKPVRFGGSSAWPYKEVKDYVESLKAQREGYSQSPDRNDDDLV